MPAHPCLDCGACCASFRVAFHWAETEPALGGATPAGLTEKVDAHRVAMRGTVDGRGPCVALQGRVGHAVSCAVYDTRPSVCRELQASWEEGAHSPQCDRARQRHGLRPLQPADWQGLDAHA